MVRELNFQAQADGETQTCDFQVTRMLSNFVCKLVFLDLFIIQNNFHDGGGGGGGVEM